VPPPDKTDIDSGRVYMLNPGKVHDTGEVKRHCLDKVNPLGGNSPHYFVCVDLDSKVGLWCPLSSKWKPHGSGLQGQIKSKYKNGYYHFLSTDSWYDVGQIWRIPHDIAAQHAKDEPCNDKQMDGNMNHVFPAIIEAIFHGGWKDKLDKLDLPGLPKNFSLKEVGLKL